MRLLRVLCLGLPVVLGSARAQTLDYEAEWRLMRAGNATLSWQENQARLHLETTGFVGKLHKVNNHYSVQFDQRFCAATSLMRAEEGKKRREIRTSYNLKPGRVEMVERDLIKDEVVLTKEIEAPTCVHDMIAGLAKLRQMRLKPGSSAELPLTTGNKTASAKVEAQKRETVKTPAGEFQTILYEAHVYNGVLYRRKARLLIWITDDERRLPVQIRVQMPFYIGTVTLKLEKDNQNLTASRLPQPGAPKE